MLTLTVFQKLLLMLLVFVVMIILNRVLKDQGSEYFETEQPKHKKQKDKTPVPGSPIKRLKRSIVTESHPNGNRFSWSGRSQERSEKYMGTRIAPHLRF